MEKKKTIFILICLEIPCSNQIYMADSQGYGLIMWNGEKFLRLDGTEFQSVRDSTHFNISGTTFSFAAGIVAMDSSPRKETLFFAPLASHHLLTFNKTELRKMFDGSHKPIYRGMKGIFKAQPSSFRLTTDGKVLFMGLVDNSIHCWRIGKQITAQNSVSYSL